MEKTKEARDARVAELLESFTAKQSLNPDIDTYRVLCAQLRGQVFRLGFDDDEMAQIEECIGNFQKHHQRKLVALAEKRRLDIQEAELARMQEEQNNRITAKKLELEKANARSQTAQQQLDFVLQETSRIRRQIASTREYRALLEERIRRDRKEFDERKAEVRQRTRQMKAFRSEYERQIRGAPWIADQEKARSEMERLNARLVELEEQKSAMETQVERKKQLVESERKMPFRKFCVEFGKMRVKTLSVSEKLEQEQKKSDQLKERIAEKRQLLDTTLCSVFDYSQDPNFMEEDEECNPQANPNSLAAVSALAPAEEHQGERMEVGNESFASCENESESSATGSSSSGDSTNRVQRLKEAVKAASATASNDSVLVSSNQNSLHQEWENHGVESNEEPDCESGFSEEQNQANQEEQECRNEGEQESQETMDLGDEGQEEEVREVVGEEDGEGNGNEGEQDVENEGEQEVDQAEQSFPHGSSFIYSSGAPETQQNEEMENGNDFLAMMNSTPLNKQTEKLPPPAPSRSKSTKAPSDNILDLLGGGGDSQIGGDSQGGAGGTQDTLTDFFNAQGTSSGREANNELDPDLLLNISINSNDPGGDFLAMMQGATEKKRGGCEKEGDGLDFLNMFGADAGGGDEASNSGDGGFNFAFDGASAEDSGDGGGGTFSLFGF